MASKQGRKKKNRNGSSSSGCPEQSYPCRGPKSIDSLALRTKSGLRLPSDASPDMRGLELSQTHSELMDRYSKLTHIIFEEGYIPVSYCYYEEGDLKSQAKYYDVKVVPSLLFDSTEFLDCNKRWLNLTKEGKANLHRILLTGYRLWQVLIYDDDERKWVPRNDNYEEEQFSILTVYGAETNSPDVMSHLSHDLSNKDMEPFFDSYLLYSWTTAFNASMTNGLGPTAVYDLFKKITELLPLVDIKTVVTIFPRQVEDLSISDSSSMNFCSPPSKRRKVKVKDEESTYTKYDDADDPDIFPAQRKHFVDLKVICRDEKTAMSKYLIMVEIHSRGKNRLQASHKFLKEIIAALQGQNAVFGIFFSYDSATLYFAERTAATNDVRVRKYNYWFLHQTSTFTSDLFNVGAFQTLVMDIFTCLVYGIEKIEN